jgi:GntR family transcriptional regulator
MNIKLNTESGVPIYLQIMEQIKNMALCGALMAGDQLPSVRELAVALKINPNTVAKVYRELQHDGVIESKWGEGNFISGKFVGTTAALEKKKIIKASLRGLIHQAENFGLTKGEIKEILSEYPEKGK